MGKKLIISLAIVFAFLSLNVSAEEQSSIDATYELFDAMRLSIVFEQTITKLVDLEIQKNPKIAPFRKVMLDFFAKYMGWESLKYDMAKIYISKFSIDEINKLKKFYETPLGTKVAMLLPEMSSEGAALGQKRVQENIGELQKMIEKELKRIQQK